MTRYSSPGAFRRALTDRLRSLATEGPWTLPQLQRQISYDRLLKRLYLLDEGLVVKGAAALARELGVRATIDIDLYLSRHPRRAHPLAPVCERLSVVGPSTLIAWVSS